MQFIDDHGAGRAQHILSGFGGEKQIERFRRCDQNMGRLAYHLLSFPLGGISGSDCDPDAVISADAR
jgi:hypothetical protein